MTNEYTKNYNLDLYTVDDRPNLLEQYNSAMNKIDEQLHENATNIDTERTRAEDAENDIKLAYDKVYDSAVSMMAGNYNDIWAYFSVELSYKNTDEVFKNMGFTGDTSITAYIRLLDSNVYYKKLTDTKSFEVPTNIRLKLTNTGSCIIDLYVTNSGKVYHTKNIVTDISTIVDILMNKSSQYIQLVQRYDSYHKASVYPVIDPPEIVESIPEYTERKTAYLIAPNLFVDTTVTDGVKGYTRIDKTQLTLGGF